MTAFAALSLLNNAAVAQTFSPVNIDSAGVAKWFSNEAILDAKKVVTFSQTLPKNGSPVVRHKMRISIPTMDTIDATKRIGDNYVNIEFVTGKASSSTIRLDLRAYVASLLNNAAVTAALTSLETQY